MLIDDIKKVIADNESFQQYDWGRSPVGIKMLEEEMKRECAMLKRAVELEEARMIHRNNGQ